MNRGDVLPRPKGERRERRLGLEAREMSTLASGGGSSTIGDVHVTGTEEAASAPVLRDATKEARAKVPEMRELGIRPGYMFREANWQIGRAEDKKGKTVRVYQKGDRFLAWRKKKARLAKAAEKRTLRGRGGKKTGGR
ncbi:MAG: hypothetical protein Q9171_006790 [Xanthocarpia ochracea]